MYWAKEIAAIRNHSLVSARPFREFPASWRARPKTLEKKTRPHTTGGAQVQGAGFRGCFWSRSDFSAAIAITRNLQLRSS